MKIAYFDCVSGCAGDMFLGALVDAGCDAEALRAAVAGIGLGREFDLRFERTMRGPLAAARAVVDVFPRRRGLVRLGEETPHEHRGLPEVLDVLRGGGLAPRALARAEAAFRLLAHAEGKIHGLPPEEVHFHEVGAVDAIVDIAGTCAALEILGVERVYASEATLGRGTIRCAHGELPAPGPAVLNILEGKPTRTRDVGHELTTPTGAALLASLAEDRMGGIPRMRLRRTGYGAGTADFSTHPNVLRVLLGELTELPGGSEGRPCEHPEATPIVLGPGEEKGAPEAGLVLLEANIDDQTPQEVAAAIEALLAGGALEAFATPCVMKKGRPGFVLSAIARVADLGAIEAAFFRETTTFGVRRRALERTALARESIGLETPYGVVEVKIGRLPSGAIAQATPEFESARKVAESKGVAVRAVLEAARAAADGLRHGPR